MTIQRPLRLNLVLFLTVIPLLSVFVAADEHRFKLTIEFDNRAGKSTPVRTVIDFDELLGGEAGLAYTQKASTSNKSLADRARSSRAVVSSAKTTSTATSLIGSVAGDLI